MYDYHLLIGYHSSEALLSFIPPLGPSAPQLLEHTLSVTVTAEDALCSSTASIVVTLSDLREHEKAKQQA